MKQYLWKDNALCLGLDNNLFFDKYEEDSEVRGSIDALCKMCPQAKTCFANGVSGKEWGVFCADVSCGVVSSVVWCLLWCGVFCAVLSPVMW